MLGNRSGFESQLLGFENLGILRCCVLLLLWNFNLSLFLSLSLCLTFTRSLPLSLYSFCSGHNTDHDSGILFGCCVLLLLFASPFIAFVLLLFIRDHIIRDHITDCIFVGNCIVCLYYVSLLFIRDHYIDL